MGPEPAHQDAEGRPLTVVGLAHAAFPKRACCRGHVVITTAKLGAPALAVLTLLGLVLVGLVGPGGLGRKWGMGLTLGWDSRLPGRGWQEEGDRL